MLDTSTLPRLNWNFNEIMSVSKYWVSNFSPFVMIATAFAVAAAIVTFIAYIMHRNNDEEDEDKGYDEEYY